MGRHVKDAAIMTPAARRRLSANRKPYWKSIQQGLHIGYRKGTAPPGSWVIRRKTSAGYREERLPGAADDLHAADDSAVLSYSQAVQRALAAAQPRSALTVTDALNSWARMKEIGGQKPHTARVLRIALKKISREWADVLISQVTVESLTAWHQASVEGKEGDAARAARATANRKLANVRAALNYAAKVHDIKEKPWNEVKQFSKKSSFGKRVVTLTPKEIEAIIVKAREVDPPLADLIEAGAGTGARLGELMDASVSDLHGDRLHVDGKTGSRVVVLARAVAARLARLAQGRPAAAPLLADEQGARWQELKIRYRFKKVLPEGVTFYALRHSYISRKLVEGVPVTALALQVGNSVQQIERSYAHFTPKHEEQWFG